MKNFIQHVVYSHREGLRWYFKSTERKGTFVISLYPWDIRLLKYGLYLHHFVLHQYSFVT